jgi:hypothetical protein
MNPRGPSEEEVNYWAARERTYAAAASIGTSEELKDLVQPCPAVVMPEKQMVAVCWELSEIDLAKLANGGKLWLVTWGGLPVHLLDIVGKDE